MVACASSRRTCPRPRRSGRRSGSRGPANSMAIDRGPSGGASACKGESRGISTAVPSLVVRESDLPGQPAQFRIAPREQLRTQDRVLLHRLELHCIQTPRLEQDAVGNPDLAHIMQRRRLADQRDKIRSESESRGEPRRGPAHTHGVLRGLDVAVLDRQRQPVQRLRLQHPPHVPDPRRRRGHAHRTTSDPRLRTAVQLLGRATQSRGHAVATLQGNASGLHVRWDDQPPLWGSPQPKGHPESEESLSPQSRD